MWVPLSTTTTMSVELHDISFKYQKGPSIFDGFNLKFDTGGFFFILGSNGSGKSTLLNLILGWLNPSSGTISYQGKEINSKKQLASLIGYVPQDPSVDPEMSVSDILDFIGSCHHLSTDQLVQNKKQITEALDIQDLLDKRIKFLSGGQRQKVNIAVGLIHLPEIILLDEPFTGLDYYTSVKVLTALVNMKKTVLCVTHDIDIAEQYATEVLVLKNGQLIEKDRPSELIKNHSFFLQEIDFNIDISSQLPNLDESVRYMIQQNRLILSYPNKNTSVESVENFKEAHKSYIIKESSASDTLKSTIVGLHDISFSAAPKKKAKKGGGGGDGSGGGGGQGKRKNK